MKSQKNVIITEMPEASDYVAHLSTKPAIAALTGLVASFPVPKVFASNAIPLLIHFKNKNETEAALNDAEEETAAI